MILSKLFQGKRINRYTSQLVNLLNQNEIKAALTLYEENLVPVETELSKSLRVTYHFLRWLDRKEDEDYRAIELLSSGERYGSQVVRAAHVIRRRKQEFSLVAALWQRDNIRLTAP
jgi:hypothetical protein